MQEIFVILDSDFDTSLFPRALEYVTAQKAKVEKKAEKEARREAKKAERRSEVERITAEYMIEGYSETVVKVIEAPLLGLSESSILLMGTSPSLRTSVSHLSSVRIFVGPQPPLVNTSAIL